MSKVTKDPKKVEAGRKGYQLRLDKLAQIKEEILQDKSTTGINLPTTGTNIPTTDTNLPTTGTNLPTTGTNSDTNYATNLLNNSNIFLGGVVVLAIGAYFYTKPKVMFMPSHEVDKQNTSEKTYRPMV